MAGLKILVGLLIFTLCVGAAVFWEAAVQPEAASHLALRQLEVHTDGTGDLLAAERRAGSGVQHLPAGIAVGVGTLALLVLMGSEVKRAA